MMLNQKKVETAQEFTGMNIDSGMENITENLHTSNAMFVESAYGFSRDTFSHSNAMQFNRQGLDFEHIALPDDFLNDYYSQV